MSPLLFIMYGEAIMRRIEEEQKDNSDDIILMILLLAKDLKELEQFKHFGSCATREE